MCQRPETCLERRSRRDAQGLKTGSAHQKSRQSNCKVVARVSFTCTERHCPRATLAARFDFEAEATLVESNVYRIC